jgi:hypothetical protein
MGCNGDIIMGLNAELNHHGDISTVTIFDMIFGCVCKYVNWVCLQLAILMVKNHGKR